MAPLPAEARMAVTVNMCSASLALEEVSDGAAANVRVAKSRIQEPEGRRMRNEHGVGIHQVWAASAVSNPSGLPSQSPPRRIAST